MINVAAVLTLILGIIILLISMVTISKVYRKMPMMILCKQLLGVMLLGTMTLLSSFGCQIYIKIFLNNLQIQWLMFVLPTLLFFSLSFFHIISKYIVCWCFNGDFRPEFLSSIVFKFFYICTTRYLYFSAMSDFF